MAKLKFGGAQYNKPHEVHDKLEALGRNYNGFYDNIMRHTFMRWDLDADEVWVEGRFRATKKQIIRWTGQSKSSFHIKWGKIVEAGLIRIEEDSVWVVTMLIRKEDVRISDAELKRMQQQQLEMAEELHQVTAILDEISSESRNVITSPVSGVPDKKGSFPDKKGSFPDSTSLLMFKKKKISLSDVNKFISGFYRAIGQKRVSKAVRDKAVASFRKLMKEGYLPGEIAFALNWIPENATEPVKHFGIVPHMIDQAIEAGKKELAIQEARQAAAEHKQEQEQDRLSGQAEHEAMQSYKEQLPEDEREELMQEAMLELRETPGLKAEWINKPVIDAKENEILRKKGIDLSDFIPPADNQGENGHE